MEHQAPPMYIKNMKNFFAFCLKFLLHSSSALKNIPSSNSFTCKWTSSYLIVQHSGHQDYNKIIDHLHATNASFHSYTFPSHRTYRVVIRNVHNTTIHSEISAVLVELGHSVKNIYNAKNKYKWSLPLFFVDIHP